MTPGVMSGYPQLARLQDPRMPSRSDFREAIWGRTGNTSLAIRSSVVVVGSKIPGTNPSISLLAFWSSFRQLCSLHSRKETSVSHCIQNQRLITYNRAPWLWHNISPAIPILFAYVFYICFSSFIHASVVDPGVSCNACFYDFSVLTTCRLCHEMSIRCLLQIHQGTH